VTADEIKARVAAVYAAKGDPEVAHGLEDQLWADVLQSIATNWAENPRYFAELALMTQAIDFPRWRA
jgi:hypothetical protein